MLIALIAILLAGTANFAMHRWMLESGHPVVEAATGPLRRALVATGDAKLVEENKHGDDFYGTVNGVGQNWLGRILMETREALR